MAGLGGPFGGGRLRAAGRGWWWRVGVPPTSCRRRGQGGTYGGLARVPASGGFAWANLSSSARRRYKRDWRGRRSKLLYWDGVPRTREGRAGAQLRPTPLGERSSGNGTDVGGQDRCAFENEQQACREGFIGSRRSRRRRRRGLGAGRAGEADRAETCRVLPGFATG